jgi:hypothetical protein
MGPEVVAEALVFLHLLMELAVVILHLMVVLLAEAGAEELEEQGVLVVLLQLSLDLF